MQFGEFENTKAFNATFKRIGELGLERNIFELDSYGFTVVPPDKVAEREFFDRIRATVLRICKERSGVDFAVERNGDFGHYKAQPQSDGQFLLFYLLMADRVFEEWIVNPTLYTLINYLMRGQQQLSSLTSFVKWKGERDTLGLHSDSPPDRDGRMPPVFGRGQRRVLPHGLHAGQRRHRDGAGQPYLLPPAQTRRRRGHGRAGGGRGGVAHRLARQHLARCLREEDRRPAPERHQLPLPPPP